MGKGYIIYAERTPQALWNRIEKAGNVSITCLTFNEKGKLKQVDLRKKEEREMKWEMMFGF